MRIERAPMHDEERNNIAIEMALLLLELDPHRSYGIVNALLQRDSSNSWAQAMYSIDLAKQQKYGQASDILAKALDSNMHLAADGYFIDVLARLEALVDTEDEKWFKERDL